MKCSASPTTSTVPSVSGSAPPAREVAAQFAALLFAQAFAPLSKAMGFYGETVVASAMQNLARNERGGLVDHLERALEAASLDAARAAG
jgi:hypothetical protein